MILRSNLSLIRYRIARMNSKQDSNYRFLYMLCFIYSKYPNNNYNYNYNLLI